MNGPLDARRRDAGDTALRIVFDLGVVVLRWRPHTVIRAALPDRAADDAAAAHWAAQVFQGYGGDWADFDRGAVTPDALAARIAARTGLTPAEARRVIDGVAPELQPLPATVALIERLRAQGRTLHFLSNMPAPVADAVVAREPALFAHFASGVFSGHAGVNKPDAAIYALAQQRFGVAPAQLVFIDDNADNVAAARALGWQGIVFQETGQVEAALHAQGWL